MTVNETLQPIPARLVNVADGGHVTGADMVFDDDWGTNGATQSVINASLSQGKQDTISDLASIRSGAAAGATAYQKPNTGIPANDLTKDVRGALDTPIIFESTCNIKPYLVKLYGGTDGGSTGIPGFRDEITYRQARSLGLQKLDLSSLGNVGGTFNEFKYFAPDSIGGSGLRSTVITSIVFPEGSTVLKGCQSLGNIFVEVPPSVTAVYNYCFWYTGTMGTIKLHHTTSDTIPTINYNYNTQVDKIYVKTGMKQVFLADTEWAKYGAGKFEEFD